MKLRKFISALAVGAMLIGSLAVNTFAASSPSTAGSISAEAKAAQAAASSVKGEYVVKDGVDVSLPAYVAPVDDATAESAVQAAHKMYGAKARTLVVFDLTVDEAEKASDMGIRLTFSEIIPERNMHFIHYENGTWDERPEMRNRLYTKAVVGFKSLSPVAIVVEETSSVQTGETLPVMPIIALISLIGIGICVSKFKFAK